jgi:hypothetical protein
MKENLMPTMEVPSTEVTGFSPEKLEDLKNNPSSINELTVEEICLYAATRAGNSGDTSILPVTDDIKEGLVLKAKVISEKEIRRGPSKQSASQMPRVQVKCELYSDQAMTKQVVKSVLVNLTTLVIADGKDKEGKPVYRRATPKDASKAASYLSKIIAKDSVFYGVVSNDISDEGSKDIVRLLNIIVQ